jgi:hypothetical protein
LREEPAGSGDAVSVASRLSAGFSQRVINSLQVIEGETYILHRSHHRFTKNPVS